MNFYKIYKHKFVDVSENKLVIYNTNQINECNSIVNDDEFVNSLEKEGYYLLSGGGAFLVNKRYLSVVKRKLNSKVNAGKLSLFTGRADCLNEILNPKLLSRELFEEALLFKKGCFLIPSNTSYDDIIEKAYSEITCSFKEYSQVKQEIYLKSTHREVYVNDKRMNVEFYVNKVKDINILFVFEFTVDSIKELSIRDGEYSITHDGTLFFQNRDTFWLDLKENTVFNNKQVFSFSEEMATEHLVYLYNNLKSEITKGY